MKKLLVAVIITLFWSIQAIAFSLGGTQLVFQQTSSALPSAPNVRICVMNEGLPSDHGEPRTSMQSLVCDYILGSFLGKKLTVNITAASYFIIQVDQSTKYNHDGSLTNYMLLPSGSAWGEAIR